MDADNAGNNYYIDDNWLLTRAENLIKITYNSYAPQWAGESRRGYSRMLAYGEYNGKLFTPLWSVRVWIRSEYQNEDTDKKAPEQRCIIILMTIIL